MDTIKILLGITVALLVGALAMSWKNFQREQRETPPEELAQLERQIAEIRQERERLRQEREGVIHGKPAEPGAPDAATPAAAVPPLAEVPDTGAVFPDEVQEEPVPAAPPQGVEDRAKAIAAAPVVAKLAEWVEDPQLGAFATLEVADASAVKAGAVLCVRRGSGILGKLKVSEVTPEGALANAVSVFGEVKPKPGDELIVEP
jgi:hypothetical protein